MDLHALANARASAQDVSASEWNARDARETVVLAIATMYLQTVSGEAAAASAEADLSTATALYELARDRERAGVSPNIDTLRALVEMQSRQQALTQVRNALDRQRIALLRMVGLPLAQSIVSDRPSALQSGVQPRPRRRVGARARHASGLQGS